MAGAVAGGSRWVAVAANPYGGSMRVWRRVGQLAEQLAAQGLACRLAWSLADRSALLAQARPDSGCCCVVAAGGDGTVADVINSRPAVPLAVLPLGVENLFARQFGFCIPPARLAAAIAGGRTRIVDVGFGAGRRFSLMLSAGFDAAVVHRVDAARRRGGGSPRRLRRLSYLKPIAHTLRSYSYGPVELDADGRRVRGTHALVFNLPCYGLWLRFAPEARADDGLLDWLVFQRPGPWALAQYAAAVYCGIHRRRPDVVCGQAARLRIDGPQPVPVQVDGDPAGQTPVQVSVSRGELTVVVVSDGA